METFEADEVVKVKNPNSTEFGKLGVVEYITHYINEERPRYCIRFSNENSGVNYFIDMEEKDLQLVMEIYPEPSGVPNIKDAIADYFDKINKAEVTPLVLKEEKQTDPKEGRKFDSDKTQYWLLPPKSVKEVADVLTFGANKKYAEDNWRHVPEAKKRYYSAAHRHLSDYRIGIENDPESSKHHLAHAICCLMFIMELDLDAKN